MRYITNKTYCNTVVGGGWGSNASLSKVTATIKRMSWAPWFAMHWLTCHECHSSDAGTCWCNNLQELASPLGNWHPHLQYVKKQQVTPKQKLQYMEVCCWFIAHYEAQGEAFLPWTVIGDQVNIHHFQPEVKIESMEWCQPTSSLKWYLRW